MVTHEEIQAITKMIKIDVQQYQEHVEKVESMIEYFNILDSANVEDEELIVNETTISQLRKDIHIPSADNKLIQRLNHYKDNYIRAPKMS